MSKVGTDLEIWQRALDEMEAERNEWRSKALMRKSCINNAVEIIEKITKPYGEYDAAYSGAGLERLLHVLTLK
jgi:hypothetical protein